MKIAEARVLFPRDDLELRDSEICPAPAREEGAIARQDDSPFSIDASVKYAEARRLAILEFEKLYLRALLERTKGNVSRAAREAGMDRVYLHRLIRRHRTKAELAEQRYLNAP